MALFISFSRKCTGYSLELEKQLFFPTFLMTSKSTLKSRMVSDWMINI